MCVKDPIWRTHRFENEIVSLFLVGRCSATEIKSQLDKFMSILMEPLQFLSHLRIMIIKSLRKWVVAAIENFKK